MSKTNHLKLYIQDLVRNYSKDCQIDFSDTETKMWFRNTLSEIDLLIHDRVRELVTTHSDQISKTYSLNDAEVRLLRSAFPEQPGIKALLKRLLPIEDRRS